MYCRHIAFASKSHSDDGGGVFVSDSPRVSSKNGCLASKRSRHLTKPDNIVCSSPDQSISASPQPLPLPELRALLQPDPNFTSSTSGGGLPLPAPAKIPIEKRGEERLSGQDAQTKAEHSVTRRHRKSLQKHCTKENSSDNCSINHTASAPTSPNARTVLSPARGDLWTWQCMTRPGVYRVQSAPEMPCSDMNPCLGITHQPCEKDAFSFDNFFQPQSFAANAHLPTSPPRTVSPLPSKISSEMTRWESNAHANVHPLPLPPGAAMSSHSNPISPRGCKSDFPCAPALSKYITMHAQMVKPEITISNIPSPPPLVSRGGNIPELKPDKSQWQKGKLIGRGTFGSVYVASNRETGALCAMKEVEILPDESKSAESLRQLQQEIKVLSHLKHPNIVQYYGSEIIGDKFYIYLEYVHPGSINKFIHDHCGAITESVVRNFTRHILCGLAYLHGTKTIHRDIKGANMLVDANGVVKLADFGMAKDLHGQTGNLSMRGSPYWLAPELLQPSLQPESSSDVAYAVDIWSLGCTIIEMMNGKPPWSEYEGAAALFKILMETPPIPETMSAEGRDFLQCCFHRNPADRPTANQLLEHPFMCATRTSLTPPCSYIKRCELQYAS